MFKYIPNRCFDDDGHDGDSQPASGHYENFNEFPSSFEILSDHQRGAVSRNAHSDADDGAVTVIEKKKNVTFGELLVRSV